MLLKGSGLSGEVASTECMTDPSATLMKWRGWIWAWSKWKENALNPGNDGSRSRAHSEECG